MAYEFLGNTGLVRTLSDVLGDLSELVQKEIRLAKAEVTENISFKLKASFWMVAAGLLGLIAALLVIQAIAFAIASFGLALHWSCLLVAAVLAAGGAAAFYHGRSLAKEQLLPERSIQQIIKDIRAVKEQLT